MKHPFIRALVSLAVFAVVYLASDFIIQYRIADPYVTAYVKSIEFLAAVIAGGCCWIGSRPPDKE